MRIVRTRALPATVLVVSGGHTSLYHVPADGEYLLVGRTRDDAAGEADDKGRMPAAGKVALVAVVGNEDGAHHTHAATFQALNDVGFTIPANAGCYWVGEAMGSVDYKDLEDIPKKVKQTLDMAASNAAHLARLLKSETYPGVG